MDSPGFDSLPGKRCLYSVSHSEEARGNAVRRFRVRFPIVAFFIDIIFPAAVWSWGRLSL